ncbi:putative reverse transcriptase domain-containing protein [Tanacetum coccineum]
MRQRRWIELFSDYDCKIRCHLGKANVVADALSRKERFKLRRVRAMSMTIQSSIKDKILAAQNEAFEAINAPAILLRGLDDQMECRSDGALYYLDQIWVPLTGDVRTLIIDEAHKSRYSVHPGADKMYYDLRDIYWWLGMKKDIYLLTKSSHFLPIHKDFKMDRIARLYPNKIVTGHGVLILIISDRDSRFTSRHASWSLEEVRTKCHSPILWVEVGEGQLIGPEIMQETTKKISKIKDRLKTARDRQKSYADKHRKPLEFSVEPVEILERQFKKLKQSRIAIFKVRWNLK